MFNQKQDVNKHVATQLATILRVQAACSLLEEKNQVVLVWYRRYKASQLTVLAIVQFHQTVSRHLTMKDSTAGKVLLFIVNHHEQVLLGQDHAILWPLGIIIAGYCLLLIVDRAHTTLFKGIHYSRAYSIQAVCTIKGNTVFQSSCLNEFCRVNVCSNIVQQTSNETCRE